MYQVAAGIYKNVHLLLQKSGFFTLFLNTSVRISANKVIVFMTANSLSVNFNAATTVIFKKLNHSLYNLSVLLTSISYPSVKAGFHTGKHM